MITAPPKSIVATCRRLAALVGCLLVLGSSSGCVNHAVNISPSLGPVDATRPMVRYKPIQGEVCNPILFYGIPLGDNSLIDALWEMKRLIGVDGYVEVAVEERYIYWVFGYTVCTVVTAYPFTYGDEPKPISVRGQGSPRDVGYASAPATGGGGGSGSRDSYGGGGGSSAGSGGGSGGSSGGSGSTGGGSSSGSGETIYGGGSATTAPAPVGPSHAECQSACERFGKLAGTSELIQRVVAQRCVERCDGGDAGYFSCVNGATAVDDVKRCNAR